MDYRFLLHFYLIQNVIQKYEILHKKWVKCEFTGLLKLVKLTFFNYICQYLNQTLSIMKENPYAKMTLDELNAKAKSLKSMTSIFSSLLLVMTFVGVFLSIRQGFSVFSVLPVAFLPLLVININSIKKIKEEIQSRESNLSK